MWQNHVISITPYHQNGPPQEEQAQRKEKKQQAIKEKMLKESDIEQRIALQDHEDERQYQQQFVDMLDKYTFHAEED